MEKHEQTGTPVYPSDKEAASTPYEMPVELEARFIRQEHRISRLFINYFGRNQWAKDDPRRSAARRAFWFSWFTVPSPAVVTGSLLAIATVGLLAWQNMLIQDQINRTAAQSQLKRRTELVTTIWDNSANAAAPKVRAEALIEYVNMERERGETRVDLTFANLSGTQLSRGYLRNCDFSYATLDDAIWKNITLDNSVFHGTKFSNTQLEGSLQRCEFTSLPWGEQIAIDFSSYKSLKPALFFEFLLALDDFAEFRARNISGADHTGELAKKYTEIMNLLAYCVESPKSVFPEDFFLREAHLNPERYRNTFYLDSDKPRSLRRDFTWSKTIHDWLIDNSLFSDFYSTAYSGYSMEARPYYPKMSGHLTIRSLGNKDTLLSLADPNQIFEVDFDINFQNFFVDHPNLFTADECIYYYDPRISSITATSPPAKGAVEQTP